MLHGWQRLVLRLAVVVVFSAALGFGLLRAVGSQHHVEAQAVPPSVISFQLFPANAAVAACLAGRKGPATVQVTVVRGSLNDSMTLTLSNFLPNVAFDLFTVQNSPQLANGSPDPNFANFGLAWYQSDVEVNSKGFGSVTINTILLDQIFGFDPAASLSPTNTFHVGFWFNDPQQAFNLGCEPGKISPVVTPFNGEHMAGPLAFISRPDPNTGLGPLCTNPNTETSPATCNP